MGVIRWFFEGLFTSPQQEPMRVFTLNDADKVPARRPKMHTAIFETSDKKTFFDEKEAKSHQAMLEMQAAVAYVAGTSNINLNSTGSEWWVFLRSDEFSAKLLRCYQRQLKYGRPYHLDTDPD